MGMKMHGTLGSFLATIVAVMLCSASGAQGGTSRESPSGEPPFGVAIQSDAAGAKLNGVAYLEYFNFYRNPVTQVTTADARVVLRLRQGKILKAFYGEAAGVNVSSPALNQAAVTAAVADDVLAAFFPGETALEITLKGMIDFGNVDSCAQDATSNCLDYPQFAPFHGNAISVADITIAVK
jgi:hypothetical protein